MDIRKSNSALLEMKILDFFHCENLPDRSVKSDCFCKILDDAKVVGLGFTIPSRKKIGVELLFLIESVFKNDVTKIHTQVNC